MSNIAVIGGCGRLGLKISLLAANKGHNVTSIDIDDERINEIKQGNLPFALDGAQIYLEQAISPKNKKLNLTCEYDNVKDANVVIITIGTPVDSNLNPSLEPVAGIIFDISEYLRQNQLIVFRNTLSPSIAGRIKTLIEDKTGFKIGRDIYLVFAPELLNENASMHDLANAPQPIGAFDEQSFKVAQEFFQTITTGKINFLTPEEALLGKLMTNMFTYIQNACANEFYLIAESYNANIHKILEAVRNKQLVINNQIPNPNPNASGPGAHKEGWFLVDRIPFAELVTTAFKINESMPAQIVQKLEDYKLNKVVILGMTNKANSDDPSSSLSYKLRKLLYYRDYNVACYDPYLPEFSDTSALQNADALILMTAHKEFSDFEKIKQLVNNPNCVYVDLQGFWRETQQKGSDGVLELNEVKKETRREK